MVVGCGKFGLDPAVQSVNMVLKYIIYGPADPLSDEITANQKVSR